MRLHDRLAGSRFGLSGLSEPTPYIVTQLGGGYINVLGFLDSQHPLRNAQDAEYYLARVAAFETVLNQEIENINADAGRGASFRRTSSSTALSSR
ncbi:MAG: hypothetical protein U1E87_06565 [Alphaproteobacteria bacterium]